MAASPHHLQMSNDEQLWLMKQVKGNAMTIDDAVSWKEARESELHNSVVRDDIAQNERSDENETDCDGKVVTISCFIILKCDVVTTFMVSQQVRPIRFLYVYSVTSNACGL